MKNHQNPKKEILIVINADWKTTSKISNECLINWRSCLELLTVLNYDGLIEKMRRGRRMYWKLNEEQLQENFNNLKEAFKSMKVPKETEVKTMKYDIYAETRTLENEKSEAFIGTIEAIDAAEAYNAAVEHYPNEEGIVIRSSVK